MEQSKALQQSEQHGREHYLLRSEEESKPVPVQERVPEGVIRIKPLKTYNDWIIILQSELQVQGNIQLSGDSSKLPEGIVVGVPAPGHGVPDGAGGRLPVQMRVGDQVKFYQRAVLEAVSPMTGFYAGKTLVVVRERDILYRMPDLLVELITEATASCATGCCKGACQE